MEEPRGTVWALTIEADAEVIKADVVAEDVEEEK